MSGLGFLRDQELRTHQGRITNTEETTMSQFAQFVAPEPSDGDRFIPKDNVGHVIVVKALEHKTGIVTSNSPNGTDAIAADVLDLDSPGEPAVYRDTLLFGGAFTDGLKGYVGQLVVVRIESRQSKSGRTYAAPVGVGDADQARAKAAFANGDPFAPEVQAVRPVAPF